MLKNENKLIFLFIYCICIFFCTCKGNTHDQAEAEYNHKNNKFHQIPYITEQEANNKLSRSIHQSKELILPIVNKSGKVRFANRVCQFSSDNTKNALPLAISYKIELASKKEIIEFKNITDILSLPLNIKIFKGEVPNALATVVDNQRIIIYKKELLDRLDRFHNASGYWSSMFILAHEIGHHLANHFEDSTVSDLDAESQADRFAGASLYRLGADSSQVLSAVTMGFLSGISTKMTTHPNREARIKYIMMGYNEASRQLIYGSALPPQLEEISTGTEDASDTEIKTEFDLSDFNDPWLTQMSGIYGGGNDYLEGIILISKADPNEEADGMEFNPVRYLLFIEITKIVGNNLNGLKVGERENFDAPKNYMMNDKPDVKITHQLYPRILQRGNKIRFKYFYYKHSYHIFYLKYLPR